MKTKSKQKKLNGTHFNEEKNYSISFIFENFFLFQLKLNDRILELQNRPL